MASQERNGGARDRQASGDGRPGAARRAESRRLSRRGFLGWATTGWIAFTAAIGGCFASFGRQDSFAENRFCRTRVFFKVLAQRITHRFVDDTFDFAISQFGFRLTFKLRMRHAHRYDCR